MDPLNIPLLANVTKSLSQNYGVLKNDEGIAYRELFISLMPRMFFARSQWDAL